MVRPTWGNVPSDKQGEARHIDKILSRCQAGTVRNILSKYSKQRDLEFASSEYRQDFDLSSWIEKLAAAVQQRGEAAANPCQSCQKKSVRLPFRTCISIAGEQYGRCANCIYFRQSCSLGAVDQHPLGKTQNMTTKQPEAQRHRQIVGDELQSKPLVDNQVAQLQQVHVPNNEATSGQYVVLGNLRLPRPTGPYRELAEKWELELQKLNDRNMDELPRRPITDLHNSFREFQLQEVAAWKLYGKNETSTHLVRPSGSLASPLAHRLNQPSYTTQFVENGETADQSNGCIAMVMGSAYRPDTLLFDHVHRRSHTSEAIEGIEYPAKVLESHEQFTNDISQSMSAKVEVLYGRKVQQTLLKTQMFEVLPLWGEFEGVTLLLAREESYRNRDLRYVFRRVMLLVSHPQHMFYSSRNTNIAQRQELTIAAAVRMVSNGYATFPWVPGYYAEKKWQGVIPTPLQQREIRLLGQIIEKKGKVFATILRDDDPIDFDADTTTGTWASYFSKTSHSNDELRKLIPEALASLPPDGESEHWQIPTDLPLPVLEWLQGQQQILFASASISGFGDIVKVLQHIIQRQVPKSYTEQRLRWLLRKVLYHQQTHLATVDGDWQQFWHSRFGNQVIQLCCSVCQEPQKPDSEPRWSVHHPGHYIPRKRRCPSKACGGQNTRTMPMDGNITYVMRNPRDLSQPPAPKGESVIPFYLRRETASHLPCPVKTWCIRCTHNTITHNGEAISIDEEPKWTIGTPLYLERSKVCKRCERELYPRSRPGATTTRFVPIDAGILSTTSKNLLNFHARYGALGRAAHEILLDDNIAASRTWKKGEVNPTDGYETSHDGLVQRAGDGKIPVNRTNNLAGPYEDESSQCTSHQAPVKPRQPTQQHYTGVTSTAVQVALSQSSATLIPTLSYPNGSECHELTIVDSSRPQVVKVKCDKCGTLCGQDYEPKWHRDTGEYVAKRKRCLVCSDKRTWSIPEDADIPFLRRTAIEAQARSLNKDIENYGPILQLGPTLAEADLQRASRCMAEIGEKNMEFTWSLEQRGFTL